MRCFIMTEVRTIVEMSREKVIINDENGKLIPKRTFFAEMLELPQIAENEIYKGILEHELYLLESKANKSKNYKRVDTKKLAEDEKYINIIRDVFADSKVVATVTEIRDGYLKELSVPKVTALMTKMVKNGELKKEMAKRVSYYSQGENLIVNSAEEITEE